MGNSNSGRKPIMEEKRKKLLKTFRYNRTIGKSVSVDFKKLKKAKNIDLLTDSEIESIYGKIDTFLEDAKNLRIEEALNIGKYKSYEEAKEEISDPSLLCIIRRKIENIPSYNAMSIVSNTSFGQNIQKGIISNEYYEKIGAARYLIENIFEITPIQFYTHYSTTNNKKYSLYPLISYIADNAPDYIKEECFWDTKAIFFRATYPEIFGDKIKTISGHDIFFCNESTKSGLIKAGNTEKIIGSKTLQYYGKEVDEILMRAISDVIYDELDLDNVRDIFMFLGQESSIYFDKTAEKPAGINDVVKKRGYSSLLDFYYLNCDKEFQIKYIEDFVDIRSKSKVPSDPFLEKGLDLMLKKVRMAKAKDMKEAVESPVKRKELLKAFRKERKIYSGNRPNTTDIYFIARNLYNEYREDLKRILSEGKAYDPKDVELNASVEKVIIKDLQEEGFSYGEVMDLLNLTYRINNNEKTNEGKEPEICKTSGNNIRKRRKNTPLSCYISSDTAYKFANYAISLYGDFNNSEELINVLMTIPSLKHVGFYNSSRYDGMKEIVDNIIELKNSKEYAD